MPGQQHQLLLALTGHDVSFHSGIRLHPKGKKLLEASSRRRNFHFSVDKTLGPASCLWNWALIKLKDRCKQCQNQSLTWTLAIFGCYILLIFFVSVMFMLLGNRALNGLRNLRDLIARSTDWCDSYGPISINIFFPLIAFLYRYYVILL